MRPLQTLRLLLTIFLIVIAGICGVLVGLCKRFVRCKGVREDWTLKHEIVASSARYVTDVIAWLQYLSHEYIVVQRRLFEILAYPVMKEIHKSKYEYFDYEANGVKCRAICETEYLSYAKRILLSTDSHQNPAGHNKFFWILQHHGGGYLSGTRISSLPVAYHYCLEGEKLSIPVIAIVVDYRLAPDHRYPAALVDAISSYSWHADRVPPAQLVISGESAGGGLALATLLAIRDSHYKKLPGFDEVMDINPPSCAVIMSPFLGKENQSTDLITRNAVHLAARIYVPDEDQAQESYASPINGEFHDLPPIFLTAGEAEIFCSTITECAEKIFKFQKSYFEYYCFVGMVHSFQLAYDMHGKRLYRRALEFVSKHVTTVDALEIVIA